MKISFVTAVWNLASAGRSEMFVRSLESISKVLDSEHIVIDGGSTDGTVEELERLGIREEELGKRDVGIGSRRKLAERKVEEWLTGVTRVAFDAALGRLVEEKAGTGEYRFKKEEDRDLAVAGAKRFFDEFARKIIQLSDGRCVYFAPDERARRRNGNDLPRCWAEYAFHAVSSSGKMLRERNFRERLYNQVKVSDLCLLDRIISNEHCMFRLIDDHPENDAVIFTGKDTQDGRVEVITRLDEYGNAQANLGEVTVIVQHARKRLTPPPKFRPLTEVVETVAKHQAAGFSPSTTGDSLSNHKEPVNGGGKLGIRKEEEGKRAEEAGDRGSVRWISERDRGIYDALNKGVMMAQGEWIHILGCDDYICDPEALEKAIEEGEKRGAEIIITPAEKEGGGRTINLKACLYSIPYCHQGVLMKRSLIERLGGFNAALKLAGDYELTLKAHLSGAKEVVLPYRFAHYSTGGASSNWAKLHAEVNEVASRIFGLSEVETARFDKTRCLPVRVLFPLLFHRRGMVRTGAMWQLIRNMVCLVKRKRCERI